MNTLIVCQPYHHKNTKKIADAMVAVLRAEVVSPSDVNTEMLDSYGLVGFGSGIAFGKHCAQILKLSTGFQFFHKNASAAGEVDGISWSSLRRQLTDKGWAIVGAFSCCEYDMYEITKLMGGTAKGRPNEQDECDAEEFAECIA